MNSRLLTLDDLCKFYSNRKRTVHFKCSEKDNEPIVVQVNGTMTFEKDSESMQEGLLPVTFQALHSGRNLNGSFISKEDLEEKFLPTFVNRPILGYIHDVDGTLYFKGHEMHIDPDTDEIVYDEVPVGIIPESNDAHLVYDEENDRYNVIINGYIFEEYSKAAEIIQREGECAVSVEIAIKEMSYAPKDKTLVLTDGYFSGITILGKNDQGDDVKPGMSGSNVRLADFKQSNNSLISNISKEEQSALVSTLEKLNETLSGLHIENYRKEDTEVKTFEENTETQESEVMETEEVEVTEVNGTEDTDPTELESQETPKVVDDGESNAEEQEDSEEIENSDEETADDNSGEESDDTDSDESSETFTRSFELSHDDIRCALYSLLSSYEDMDSEWYFISEVYDDHFIYEGCFEGKIYRQNYTKENDLVSFDGEREEMYRELLTASEKAELEEMRSNYSSIQTELNSYKDKELASQRDSILADEAYSEYLDTAEFKKIRENLNTYSLEDLRTECELAYAKAVRGAKKLNFSVEEPKKPTPSFFGFAHVEKQSSFLDGLLKSGK